MNVKILMAAVAALSVAGAGMADAASHNKRHYKARYYRAPVAAYVPATPYGYPGPRPIWAAPGSCWTDEGNGRYLPCDFSIGGRP
jgi:hypothetical protein